MMNRLLGVFSEIKIKKIIPKKLFVSRIFQSLFLIFKKENSGVCTVLEQLDFKFL